MDGPGLSSIAAALQFHVPQFDANAWIQLTILVVALILCALASAAETALTSISRIKLKNMVEEGDQRAVQIEHLLAEPNTFLTTILVVNSVALIVASGMATVLALRFSETWGELASIIVISLVVLIACEISPKTAAVQNPLRWALFIVGPVRAAAWLLHPIVWCLNGVTAFFVRLMGGRIRHRGPFVTEEELRLLVTAGEEEGVLEQEETQMINSIFEFADTTVREVMVPRIDMITLSSEATVNNAVDLALEGGFSRIPVYEESVGVDEVIGVLYTKDMLKQLREGHHLVPVRDLVRPAYYVPETKKLDGLLREIRQNRVHMVIAVDEYGSVAGLVTIEDLVEEIVGDIQDEYDHEEKLYEQVSMHQFIFDAKVSIYDFNELMDMHLDDSDYETLGGFVYAQLDKIPNANDTITFENHTFTVLATRGRRITKIRVERVPVTSAVPQSEQPDMLLLPTPQERDEQSRYDEQEQQKQTQGSEAPSNYEYRGA
ncbi:MAG TPA: hemolysin family protein [Ktedonobacteraceae bacterium]|jgi:CBS domain containing-hemolysin-like protein|nr:hemolysin family protein [Ktedonobacteraceae bacterium]